MVRIVNPNNYTLIGFQKSNRKDKMYAAILQHKKLEKFTKVHFGDPNMENYQDKTGLNMYPKLIHGDKKRRKNFRKRHKKNAQYKYSSAYFSYKYLW